MVHGSLINNIETLKQKDNEKRFKSIFSSKYKYQQALNAYK